MSCNRQREGFRLASSIGHLGEKSWSREAGHRADARCICITQGDTRRKGQNTRAIRMKDGRFSLSLEMLFARQFFCESAGRRRLGETLGALVSAGAGTILECVYPQQVVRKKRHSCCSAEHVLSCGPCDFDFLAGGDDFVHMRLYKQSICVNTPRRNHKPTAR